MLLSREIWLRRRGELRRRDVGFRRISAASDLPAISRSAPHARQTSASLIYESEPTGAALAGSGSESIATPALRSTSVAMRNASMALFQCILLNG